MCQSKLNSGSHIIDMSLWEFLTFQLKIATFVIFIP